jgi:WD40 repeat protein
MSANLPPDFCPYKGLQPYTEADRAFFFGRERDAAIIISNLYAAPLTILYGASGVGKSSVLLAGVVPELRETPRIAIVVFRSWQDAGFVSNLKTEVLRAITQSANKEVKLDCGLPLDEFLFNAAQALRGPIFIILDQFEEYFLYHPVSQGADGFEAELARAVNRREVDVNFLLSMREDGLSKLDRFQGRIPNMLNNMLRLDHLNREAANDAIRKPLDEYNRRQADAQSQVTIEDELARVLLDDLQTGKVTSEQTGQGKVNSRARDEKIETPFLQMVLTRLWDEERAASSHVLRLSTFEALGRTVNIARTHLDNMMGKLSVPERSIAARVLRYLVTPSGTKIAQEPGALVAWAELDEEPTQAILDRLSAPDMRILRKVSALGQNVKYEIFHDVIAQAILDWRARFQREEKRSEMEKKLVAERALAASKLAQEKQRAKTLRWGTIVLSVLLISTVGLLYLLFRTRAGARSRDLASYAISQLPIDPELSLILSIKAVELRHTTKAEAALRQSLVESHVQAVMRGSKGAVRDAAFSPDGRLVATASFRDYARVWDAGSGQLLQELHHADQPDDGVYSVTFSPDGKYLVTTLWDNGKALVWDVGTWKPLATLADHTQTVYCAAFSPNSEFLVTTSDDKSPRVWRVGTWERIAVLQGQGKPVAEPVRDESIPGQTPVSGPSAGAPVSGTGTPAPNVAEMKPEQLGHGNVVYSVAFSPNGKYVITAGRDRVAWIWEVGTWHPLTKLTGYTNPIKSASFSPDGEYVVTGSDDRTARVWKLDWEGSQLKGKEVSRMEHPSNLVATAFSPDGQYVLTTCFDKIARLWKDWKTGRAEVDADETDSKIPKPRVAFELRGHTHWLFGGEFSRDGRFVVTSSQDKTARVWRTDDPAEVNGSIDELLALARTRVTRQLTTEERKFYLDE